jgi:hypothetical protein
MGTRLSVKVGSTLLRQPSVQPDVGKTPVFSET